MHASSVSAAVSHDGHLAAPAHPDRSKKKKQKKRPAEQSKAEALKAKHPLEEILNEPVPDWYPSFWPPAVEGCAVLVDDTARSNRAARLASPATPYAIPQDFTKRREKYWRVMPTAKFANASTSNQSRIFAFAISIAPYLGTHVTTEDDSGNACDVGLPGALWKKVATLHGEDFGHKDGFERTKVYLRQFGMKFVIDRLEGRAPVVISRREKEDRFILPPLDDVDAVDYGEVRLVDLDAQEWDPCYLVRDHIGAAEELRYQSEPLGWRYTALDVRRNRDAFIFVIPGSPGALLDGEHLQWQEIAITDPNFAELLIDSDLWECYDHGLVFLLPRYGDPDQHDACGERFLNSSVIYRTSENGEKAWFTDATRGADAAVFSTEPFVLKDRRIWHGHDEQHPYVRPSFGPTLTDSLLYVGSLFQSIHLDASACIRPTRYSN